MVESVGLPAGLTPRFAARLSTRTDGNLAAALIEGERIAAALPEVAALPEPIVTVHVPREDGYQVDWLLEEARISLNTTATGGNASLMIIG